jgi:hypothetical protein
MSEKPKVKRQTLAQIIADYIKRNIPNARGWTLEKRKGRMEVQVSLDPPPRPPV